jgi:hypothetical protein
MALPSAFRSLRHRNYQLFFGGQIISLVGTWMQAVTESWLMYRLTGSSALLGLTGFSAQIPVFLLATLGGIVADRYDRRRIIVTTQACAMLLAGTLAALTLHGSRAGVAPVRDRRTARHRERLRHPRAPGLRRRHGGTRGSDQRHRAQLVDVQRRPHRGPGRRGRPRRRDRRGLVPPSALRHPPSAFRLPPSAFRLPPSARTSCGMQRVESYE